MEAKDVDFVKKEHSEDICKSSKAIPGMESAKDSDGRQNRNLKWTEQITEGSDIRRGVDGVVGVYKAGCTPPFVRDGKHLFVVSKKDKISRRKLFQNEEEVSPVLGLRIVPAKEYKARYEVNNLAEGKSKLKQDNNETSGKINIGSPSGEPGKTAETPILSGFACKLCSAVFCEPLQLAQHRCARIENVKYDCPECGKSFSCPANLASHRRWHKPKESMPEDRSKFIKSPNAKSNTKEVSAVNILKQMIKSSKTASVVEHSSGSDEISAQKESETLSKPSSAESHDNDKAKFHTCSVCHKSFRRKSYLKHHIAAKHSFLSVCNLTAKAERSIPCTPKEYKPIAHDSDVSVLNKFPVYPGEGLMGLAALAYAAEFHSRLLPPLCDRIVVNNPSSHRNQNESLCEKNISLKNDISNQNDNLKRTLEPDEGLFQRKKPKMDDSIAIKSSWFPPSPPVSETSRSSGSIASDSEEGQCDGKNTINLSQPDKSKNHNNDYKTILPQPAYSPAITTQVIPLARQCSPGLSQNKRTNLVTSPPQGSLTNLSALRFNEPFHPYPYHCGIAPRRPAAFIPTWNSWGNHASWKGIFHHFPSVIHPPALRISK